jgi:hypothetical protein
LQLLPIAALLLTGPLSRWRADDWPREFRGLVDSADIAERELAELRNRVLRRD